ncbi:MAG: N-formylglutamate amidohydrolase [Acidiferrobacterales bacterium]
MSHTITNVLERHDANGDLAPAVFDSPHSGTVYPSDFGHALPRNALRRAEDAFVDKLYQAVPSHGASLLCALFPRSYVDPNRAADDIDESLLDGPWPDGVRPGPKVALGIGLIARREPGGSVYDRKLTVAEVQQRLNHYYWPYHRELERLLNQTYDQHGGVWHVNCHSMPAVSTVISPEGPGVKRPDFCIGDRDGTTCDSAFTAIVAETLHGMGYAVTVNDPYKGVEIVRRYSDPRNARHSLQIEVNRGLYMDEDSIEMNHGFTALQKNLGRLIEAICNFAREQLETDKR